jgi:exopolysaccharide production protein ExoY
MLICYVMAGLFAGAATAASARHRYGEYFWHWDRPTVLVGLTVLGLIGASSGIAVAALAAHWQLEPIPAGAGREWGNGAIWGALGFALLHLDFSSFGLEVISPVRLLHKIADDAIAPVLEAAGDRSVRRWTGDLPLDDLRDVAYELLAIYFRDFPSEVERVQASIRLAYGEAGMQIENGPGKASLRVFVREAIVGPKDSTIDRKLRGRTPVANEHEPARVRAIASTVLVPTAVLLTGGLAIWQFSLDELDRAVLLAAVVVLVGTSAVRVAVRHQRLRSLLRGRKRRVKALTPATMHVREEDPPSWRPVTAPSHGELVEALRSRRLVLLVGERGTGRTKALLSALQRDRRLAPYRLIRPSLSIVNGRSSVEQLLVPRLLPRRGRYVLWLEDIGQYVQRTMEPRVIERWLAGGLGRVAVGTITPTELEAIDDAELPASVPLKRAQRLDFTAGHATPPPGAAAARFARLIGEEPQSKDVVRIVAACRLLGLQRPGVSFVAETYGEWRGAPLSLEVVRGLAEGAAGLLNEEDELLSVDVELERIVERELSGDAGIELLAAMTRFSSPADVLTLAAALAERTAFDQARLALEQIEETADPDFRLAALEVWMQIAELKDVDLSGARLSGRGGFDYREPMGPLQRKAAEKRLAPATDGVFDSTLPDDGPGGFATRFYRLTVYRGLARSALLFTLDSLAVACASAAALVVRAGAQSHPGGAFIENFVALAVPGCLVVAAVAVALGLYRGSASRAQPQQLLGTMAVFTTVVAAGFLVANVDVGSVLALVVLFAVAFVVSLVLRYAYDRVSRRWVRWQHLQKRVLMIGDPVSARKMAREIGESHGGEPVQIVGYVSPLGQGGGFCAGGYAELREILLDLHVAEVVMVDRYLTPEKRAGYIEIAQRNGIDVRYVPRDPETLLAGGTRVDDYGLVRSRAALITPEALELKRLIDAVLVTLAIPFWLPVIGAYAGFSKSRRKGQPVFAPAERIGLGNRAFLMLRLRTRRLNADGSRGEVASGRIEAWMERWGLDELPVAINILRGEMSVVGPRPLAALEAGRLEGPRARTLQARPGITGRWQVARSYGVSEDHGRTMDVDYLRRWRVTHDLELLMRTPVAVLVRGFYLGDTRIADART